jgi:hypothetical protein
MIAITKITQHNYTLIIDGNDGENQMLITMCADQSGKTGVQITTVSVDNHYIQTLNMVCNRKDDYIKFVADVIVHVQLAWIRKGLKGDYSISDGLVSDAIKKFFAV